MIYMHEIMNYRTVTLWFLIPGHTKYQSYGTFGLVKQLLKTLDVNFPSEIMVTMDDSSKVCSGRTGM